MFRVGYHASHELYSPRVLLERSRYVESLGFKIAMCSDHFHPWSEQNGQSGFAWSWLGAALEATNMTFGTVCAPGQRYHPAIIAQAAATLGAMYPGRFWLAVGSGENLNESITGREWPSKEQRNARLREAVDVMRELWRGNMVNHSGAFEVVNAKLFTIPLQPIPIFGAALTVDTARWIASWADGMITAGSSVEGIGETVRAFHDGGGFGKPIAVQIAVCHAETEETALAHAHRLWRHAALDKKQLSDLPSPSAFDSAVKHIRPRDLADKIWVATDLNRFVDEMSAMAELEVSDIYIHYVGDQFEIFFESLAPHAP